MPIGTSSLHPSVKSTPSFWSPSYVPSRVTKSWSVRNVTHHRHLQLFTMALKNMKSKRSLTVTYILCRNIEYLVCWKGGVEEDEWHPIRDPGLQTTCCRIPPHSPAGLSSLGCSTGDTAGGLEAYHTRTRQHRNRGHHRIHGCGSTPRGI